MEDISEFNLRMVFHSAEQRDRFMEWMNLEHKEMIHALSCGALTPIGKGYKDALDQASDTVQFMDEEEPGGETSD